MFVCFKDIEKNLFWSCDINFLSSLTITEDTVVPQFPESGYRGKLRIEMLKSPDFECPDTEACPDTECKVNT